MILVTVEPVTPAGYRATATIDGKRYAARGRLFAVPQLARKLAAAGIADLPMVVEEAGFAPWRNTSLWAMAKRRRGYPRAN